ncbi:F-box protein SKP2A [Hibiscus syriacus]|uniref:F-box protein SKP2A n=1 Tax=Hibiscus syriacus TaxID=106335 RepID=A0A6A3BJU3_HIBSY|nr:F-box protein SKP2A [Hibiscus syriacus]
MIGQAKVGNENLDLCFVKLMMVAVGNTACKGVEMNGVGITQWKDIPVELLLRIVSLLDDQTANVLSGVCSGWRDAISFGLTRLCLSWTWTSAKVSGPGPQQKFQDLDLNRLNISGCTSFSDEALAYLTNFCLKLKLLNLRGCIKAATNHALQAIGRNCNALQSLNMGWCDNVGDHRVMSLAYGCPDLRCLDLCGCMRITDDSVIALANVCVHLRSLGLYYCRNITDSAMYSLAQSRMKNKGLMWKSMKGRYNDEDGLKSLNISQCTAQTPSTVQALCDTFSALHTCSGRHSLVMSGSLNLTFVHCSCAVQSHRTFNSIYHTAHSRDCSKFISMIYMIAETHLDSC